MKSKCLEMGKMATPPNRAYLTVANAFAQICSANAPQTSDTLGTLYAKTLEIKVKDA